MFWRRITRLAQRDSLTAGLITGAAVVWLIAIYFVFMGSRGVFGGDASVAASAPSTRPAPPPPPPRSKPAPQPVKEKPIDVNACVTGLLPSGSFLKQPPNFDFVCSESDPVKGGLTMKSAIIKGAAGSTSQAMRDWVKLGWYEMLAYSLMRSKCCTKAPPLKWGFDISCPVDKPLKRFEKAVRARETAAFDKIFFEYAEEIRCLSRFGQAPDFNQGAPPGSGIEIINAFLDRAGLKP